MKPYVDYEFFINYCGLVVEEDKFERYALLSTQFLKRITAGRSENARALAELQYACCEIIKTFYESDSEGEKEVASENNDGYSVTYLNERRQGESKQDFMNRKAYKVASDWLAGTGLLNRKVGC